MKEALFVTGATGFLGAEIIRNLVKLTDETIYVLVRANDEEAALHRLKAAWYYAKDLYEKIGAQVRPVVGDFTLADLGFDAAVKETLLREVKMIYHVGAEIGLQKTGSEFDSVNKEGTANVVNFAKEIPDLKRFVHVSTAYVAGQQTGKIMETLAEGQEFSSLYEKSKSEAEILVRDSGLPWTICRPGMIIGDSKTGRVKNFNTIYYILKLL